MFRKKLKRGPQVILPKDAALILAYSGIAPGSKVVDAGAGSGFLATFLGTYLRPGKVYTYETDERFLQIVKDNIVACGLEDVVTLKHADVTKGIKEKDVDLVTLDLRDAKKALKHAKTALVDGGMVVTYSPTIEHLMGVLKELKKLNFSEIKPVENIVREWKTELTTRPETMGLMHTGFLTFAKKIK
ncbi:MAG: methyltransferase [Candidatus Aenigmarchaeota archaeon]|nr:methyltransferase [Candidatus Aenigmarchaeota archaeon]